MKKSLLIIVVGHNASGKTTLVKKLLNTFDLNYINGDIVRQFIIENVNHYRSATRSHDNDLFNSMNRIVDSFRVSLFKELASGNQPIIIDGAGVHKRRRQIPIGLLEKHKNLYTTVIIECILPEEDLLLRLRERDVKNPTEDWEHKFISDNKNSYEPVDNNEADIVLRYDQGNFSDIKKAINDLVNK